MTAALVWLTADSRLASSEDREEASLWSRLSCCPWDLRKDARLPIPFMVLGEGARDPRGYAKCHRGLGCLKTQPGY
ncbi:hypothetical protein ACOMHN_045466 [Nucella lapillus]